VEDAVFRRLGDLCTDPKLARQVAQRINARRDDTAPQRRRLAAIAGERAEAGKAKAKYLAAFESDALPADLVGARTREIADRVAALDAEEGRLRAVVDAEPAPEVDPEAVRAVLARFHEVLQRAPHMEKRALLRVLVRRITLNAERDLDSIEVTISDELAAALGADASLPPASEGGVTVAV
jgi:site-specific DNA recombinase